MNTFLSCCKVNIRSGSGNGLSSTLLKSVAFQRNRSILKARNVHTINLTQIIWHIQEVELWPIGHASNVFNYSVHHVKPNTTD